MIASREYVKDLITKVLSKFTKNKVDPLSNWMYSNKQLLDIKCFTTGNNTGKYIINNIPKGNYIIIGSGNSWGAFANGQKAIHIVGNGEEASVDTLNTIATINTSGSNLGYSLSWNAPSGSPYATLTISSTMAYRLFFMIRLDSHKTIIESGTTISYDSLNF